MKKGIILVLCLVLSLSFQSQAATSVRKTDVKKAASGNVLVGVEGVFDDTDTQAILNRINEIRKEACDNGYINPSTGKKLKKSDYVPVQWSSDLEWLAQTRAAEASVYESHSRPNGTDCFTCVYKGKMNLTETLAWGGGIINGINNWYREKEDWVNQNENAVTGHYTFLINPSVKVVGIGGFSKTEGGWTCVAGKFSSEENVKHDRIGATGKMIQTIEVSKNSLSNYRLSGPSKLKKGKSTRLYVLCTTTYPGIMGSNVSSKCRYLDKITWKSSKSSVMKVSSTGKVTAVKKGKATITAKLSTGKKISKTINVN